MSNEIFGLGLKFMFHIVFQDLYALVHRQAARIDKQGARIEEQSVEIKVREYFHVKVVANNVIIFYHIKCPINKNLL